MQNAESFCAALAAPAATPQRVASTKSPLCKYRAANAPTRESPLPTEEISVIAGELKKSFWSFVVPKDEAGPELLGVEVQTGNRIGSSKYDTMILTLSEPMAAMLDASSPHFSRLSLEKEKTILTLTTSEYADGRNTTVLSARPSHIRIPDATPNTVYLDFGEGTLEPKKIIDVVLENDFRDPADNPPNLDKNHLTWKRM